MTCKLKYTTRAIMALAGALFLVACEEQGRSPYQGGLFFGQGSYLMRFSLQDGGLSVEGHLGDTEILEVSPFGNDHLLISESASVNRLRVPRISWFDIDTGETADLYAGVAARFVPETATIVYDNGTELFAVPQIDNSDNQLILAHGQNLLGDMLVVQGGIVLFEMGRGDELEIHAWNAIDNSMTRLEGLETACRLDGAVWIAALDRLACKPPGAPAAETAYSLANLEGSQQEPLGLPAGRNFRALVYVPGQDALVLQETEKSRLGSRDQYSVWVYNVVTKELTRIADNIFLGAAVAYGEY